MNLIETVLKLDAEATKGPWVRDLRGEFVDWGAVFSDIRVATATTLTGDISIQKYYSSVKCTDAGYPEPPQTAANANLIALYRTAAPKLARALDNTKKKLAVLERLTVGGTIGDIAREILAEIEKELSNG